MSLIFGIYTSIIGITVVFITLLLVAAVSEIMRRMLSEKIENSSSRHERLLKIAAVSAVHRFTSQSSPPGVKSKASLSRWPTQARIEALKMKGDRPR